MPDPRAETKRPPATHDPHTLAGRCPGRRNGHCWRSPSNGATTPTSHVFAALRSTALNLLRGARQPLRSSFPPEARAEAFRALIYRSPLYARTPATAPAALRLAERAARETPLFRGAPRLDAPIGAWLAGLDACSSRAPATSIVRVARKVSGPPEARTTCYPFLMGDGRDEAAEARRRARQTCEVRVFRPGSEAAEAEASALDWASIPLRERAEFVWQLSVELCRLAGLGSATEGGPGASAGRVRGWRRREIVGDRPRRGE